MILQDVQARRDRILVGVYLLNRAFCKVVFAEEDHNLVGVHQFAGEERLVDEPPVKKQARAGSSGSSSAWRGATGVAVAHVILCACTLKGQGRKATGTRILERHHCALPRVGQARIVHAGRACGRLHAGGYARWVVWRLCGR